MREGGRLHAMTSRLQVDSTDAALESRLFCHPNSTQCVG